MAIDGTRDFSPFGWSVGRGGRKPGQVRDDVRTLVEQAKKRWMAVFPQREGYQVRISSPAGASNGVRMVVERGNFRASVSVESILDPARRSSRQEKAIRMYGRAEASSLVAAEQTSYRAIQRLRQSGTAISLVVFFLFLWLIAGAQSGAYILAGLLTMVAGVTMTTLGASVGAYLGERVAESSRQRALAQTADDKTLQDDLRRWRALSREFSSTKHQLQGQLCAGPFRALSGARPRRATKTRTPSRPLPKLATSSFSFSFSSS